MAKRRAHRRDQHEPKRPRHSRSTEWNHGSYVEADSIDDIVAKAKELGGRVVLEKSPISETNWYAAEEDAEGNQIGLSEGTTAGADDSTG